MEEEIVWYMNFDWSMIWVCILGVAAVITLMVLDNEKARKKTTGSIDNYFIPTWKNYLFHLLAGLLMLTFISEVGIKFLNYYIELPQDLDGGINHFLAALSGIGGGFVIAKIVRLFQKLN